MSENTPTPQNTEAAVSAEDRGMRPGPRPDKDALGMEGAPKFKGKRRRKVSFLTTNKIDSVDYKDVALLRRFLNDRGKILPARQTGNTAKQQRMIASAIRKARELALIPFVVSEMGSDRREYGPRRDRGPREYNREPRNDGPRNEGPRNDGPRSEAPRAEAPKAESEA